MCLIPLGPRVALALPTPSWTCRPIEVGIGWTAGTVGIHIAWRVGFPVSWLAVAVRPVPQRIWDAHHPSCAGQKAYSETGDVQEANVIC
jgi:hypothetical protein